MAAMFYSFLILLCFLISLPLESFECPRPLNTRHGFCYAPAESNMSGRASEEYSKLRIKQFNDPSIEDKPYKELLQQATDFWSKALSVKPVRDPLFKSRACEFEDKVVYKALNGSAVKEKYCLGSCATVTKCHDFEIPNEHVGGCKSCNEEGNDCTKQEDQRGAGIENADLVFYVTAIETAKCLIGATATYVGLCETEPVLDRPVFGLVHICSRIAAKLDNKSLLRIFKHEMMHALGFGFFHLFRDKDGQPLWRRDKNGLPIAKDIESALHMNNVKQKVYLGLERDWHVRGEVIKSERLFLVTPNVVREARNHFGCPNLEGAELEDQGPPGTKYCHLEARVFYDDAMKGNVDTGKGLFSRIDFAVLDDSGWYQVDYSRAEEMEFGRKLGCNFCMKSCKFWMDTQRMEGKGVKPFCDTADYQQKRGFSCNGTKIVFSGCPLLDWFNLDVIQKLFNWLSNGNLFGLPLKYQNFDQISGVRIEDVPRYGSIENLPDFCPIPITTLDVTADEDVAKYMHCDETSQSSQLHSSFVLVSIFTCLVIIH